MGETSSIQWTDATWNPWHGCIKVSEGCKFCYMYRDKERYGQDPTVVLRSKTKFNEPLKWKEPKLIFTCSWSDWFIEQADQWRPEAWEIIRNTPQHTYQILTKRPERILEHLPADWGNGYPNVWLGVSVENRDRIGRIKELSKVPSVIKFISAEPLLGPLDLPLDDKIDWIIVGGESGNDKGKYGYRPCEIEWIKDIIEQGWASALPVFVKQLGTSLAHRNGLKDSHGGNWDEWPEAVRVRQMPIIMEGLRK